MIMKGLQGGVREHGKPTKKVPERTRPFMKRLVKRLRYNLRKSQVIPVTNIMIWRTSLPKKLLESRKLDVQGMSVPERGKNESIIN